MATTVEQFKKELTDLVNSFHKNIAHLKLATYDESSLRNDFITPFWHSLGWDVYNKQGLTQTLRDVQIESRVDVAGKKKRADYLFRTGGNERFVCEAKKPHEDLKKWAFQAQRYAFNLRLRIATLGNFDSLQIFVVGGKPDKAAPWAICKQWHYTEYVAQAQAIWDLFGRENVANGALERYVETLPKKEIKEKARQGWLIPKERVRTVDADFLEFIEDERAELARVLVEENKGEKWEASSLNECIERILDRILFVRICEDRDIDTGKTLERILDDWEQVKHNRPALYPLLVSHFNVLDESFNGALFKVGHMSESLDVPDDFLVDIIRELSSEDSPYLFSTLPVEILGSVYEQFIGKVVIFTRSGTPTIVDKPDVRKAGGVYYTPRYVVDYIVAKTVGALVHGKTPKEVEKFSIVDPSCGSGSFLIRVFEWLCQYYLEWYHAHPKEQKERFCYKDEQGNLHLTTHLKRQIMLNNVFGVDVDYQAVEVTMLSLYLKILEGETRSTLGKQRSFFPKETFLPDLGDNIKCGNSLIGTDYHEQMSLLSGSDEEEHSGTTNAFDWEHEFSEIMEKKKFDVVVGNPPWGASFNDDQREYLAKKYSNVVARMVDSYIYFIGKATELLSKPGVLGFIVPSTILNQVDASPVRELLLDRGLSHVISLGQGVFGTKVLNTSTIVVSRARHADSEMSLGDLSSLRLDDRPAALLKVGYEEWESWKKLVASDPHLTYFLTDRESTRILGRLRKKHAALSESLVGTIQRGVSPDIAAAHVITKADAKTLKLEKELLKRSLSGSQIRRYEPFRSDQFIIYTGRETDIQTYPNIKAFMKQFRSNNSCPEVADKKHPWYALHRPRDPEIFKSPKFIGLTTTKKIELVYDEEDDLFVTDAMYVFTPKKGIDPWALMAVMQSKAFLFLYRISNQGESRVIPQIKAAKLEPLPIPELAGSADVKTLSRNTKKLLELNEKLSEANSEKTKTALERLIWAKERHNEEVVCKLYGLSKPEIALVEEMFEAQKENNATKKSKKRGAQQVTLSFD
jgi:type I restriction-modification system DNA methylase subunit